MAGADGVPTLRAVLLAHAALLSGAQLASLVTLGVLAVVGVGHLVTGLLIAAGMPQWRAGLLFADVGMVGVVAALPLVVLGVTSAVLGAVAVELLGPWWIAWAAE